jgi:aspartate racemase
VVAARLGGNHCASLVLWQDDFARITELQECGQWAEAGEVLADGGALHGRRRGRPGGDLRQHDAPSTDLFPKPLGDHGIEVVVPEADEQAAIQRHTFDELIRDIVTPQATRTFRAVCDGLMARGAQAVVLACTEHGMVLNDGDLSVPILDSTELHIAALIDHAFA